MMTTFRLTPEQYELLTRPLDAGRVGKNPKGYSHLEAWDVRRWLIRIFGFGGFCIETISLDLVKEIELAPGTVKYRNGGTNDKTIWTVIYQAQVRLTVYDQFGGCAVFEDGACGDSTNQPALGDCHDNATKTALSQALKRCAVNLGDAFGLSLYNAGGVQPVVIKSVVAPDQPGGAVVEVPQDAPVQPEPAPVPEEPVSAPPAPPAPPAPSAPNPAQVRDWALDKQRTASGLQQAAEKLRREHPAVAATVVVNESGDEEPLAALMERRARELTPAQPAQANGHAKSDEQRRRERMHALAGEKGLSRDDRLRLMTAAIGRQVTSSNELTWPQEVEMVISELERYTPAATPVGASV